ncbi:heme-binding domain-containing protein [Olivibacter sp. CPCC 100613]|uniref:heme-binding domain-containing protein n=1 Tax=Olivibacter sp. CPCC 100613 TaxID=3079931 RepID=UPI002FF79B1D
MVDIKRKWAVVGGVLLTGIAFQFILRTARTNSVGDTGALTKIYDVPKEVNAVLRATCFDCHSNHTDYPWYSNIQPFAKFMEGHILQGKEALNFDEFGSYSVKKQYNKLRSVENQLKDGTMPLRSYAFIHRDARLTKEEINLLINWSKDLRNKIANKL